MQRHSLRRRVVLPRALPALAALAAAAAAVGPRGPQASAGEPPGAERVFFREPDSRTAKRIETLVARMPSSSVEDRWEARRELERIGFWAVDPLLEAARTADPPHQSAAILVLDAIGDRRAAEPLREVMLADITQIYVSAFAALALGRLEDEGAVPVMREATSSTKQLDLLRAAVALALARIGTPEAGDALRGQFAHESGNEFVRTARLLALGFFPDAALEPNRPLPGPELAAGLAARPQGERQAAMVGYLVATAHRRDTREFLLGLLAQETNPVALRPILVGLSRYADAEVTVALASVAESPGSDESREFAADLCADRGDPVALETWIRLLHTPQSSRLRAAAVLALSSIDDERAARAVHERIRDQNDLIRSAAVVASTRLVREEWRQEARRRIDLRLKAGGLDDTAIWNLRMARSVLDGERTSAIWREVGAEVVFRALGARYEDRLLQLVNARVETSLDLDKIHNLQTDTESVPLDGQKLEPVPPPTVPDDPAPAQDDTRPVPPSGRIGQTRTNAWQELRDLKSELRRLRPYFGPEHLPAPPEATTR